MKRACRASNRARGFAMAGVFFSGGVSRALSGVPGYLRTLAVVGAAFAVTGSSVGSALAQLGAGQVAPPSSPIDRVLPTPQPRAEPRLLQQPETPPPVVDGGAQVAIGAVEITRAPRSTATTSSARYYDGIVGQKRAAGPDSPKSSVISRPSIATTVIS